MLVKLIVPLLALLWLALMPWLHYQLRALWDIPGQSEDLGQAQVIVVLGAGPDPQPQSKLNPALVARTQAAEQFHKNSGLPLLLTGGKGLQSDPQTEAQLMQELLAKRNISPWLLEQQSRSTWQNAFYSAALLHQQGVHKVAVLSHAWHLRRALRVFNQAGLSSVGLAVPDSVNVKPKGLTAFLPHGKTLKANIVLLHEMLGLLYYRLRLM